MNSDKNKKKWLKVWHLYTAAYTETRPAAVYNSKWRTDWQWHKWRSASSGHPLPEWTDFGPRSLQLDRPTYAPASRTMTFTPQCSPATTHYFSSECYQILIATHLPTPEGWKAESALLADW